MVGFDVNILSSNVPADLGTMLLQLCWNLVIALVWLVAGYYISDIISRVLTKAFEGAKVEDVFKKFKVEDALGGNQVTPIFITLVRWYVVLLFLQGAVAALQMMTLTNFLNEVLMFAPKVIGVALFVIVAAIVGEWVREAVLSMKRFYMQATLAQVSRLFIVLSAIMVGLDTLGFQMTFVYMVFGYLLQGIVYGIALAFGLAFGLGGQKDATDMIKKARKRFDI